MRSAVRTFDLADLLTETPEDELASASEKEGAELPVPGAGRRRAARLQRGARPPAPAPSARREVGEATPSEAESSAPEATPAAKPGKSPRRVKLKKAVKTPRASMPRFEQIDMFTAVEQAAADALPPVPAGPGKPGRSVRAVCRAVALPADGSQGRGPSRHDGPAYEGYQGQQS